MLLRPDGDFMRNRSAGSTARLFMRSERRTDSLILYSIFPIGRTNLGASVSLTVPCEELIMHAGAEQVHAVLRSDGNRGANVLSSG